MGKLKGFYKNNRIYCIMMAISIFCIALIGVAFLVYFINQTKISNNTTHSKITCLIKIIKISKPNK